jgi:hypothetical protein
MKQIMILFALLFTVTTGFTQTDKDKLALAINSADEANTKQLMQFIWKRKSDVVIDGQQKLTTLSEFSFDDDGQLQSRLVDAESSVQQKRGVRGKIQENAAEDKADYVQKALKLSLTYSFTDTLDEAMVKFAFAYADQTEKDFLALKAAVKNGRIELTN